MLGHRSWRAAGSNGERWLRVVSQEPEWTYGEAWIGTLEANQINEIRKPVVLDVREWSERDQAARAAMLE